jgi:hypothetical protein
MNNGYEKPILSAIHGELADPGRSQVLVCNMRADFPFVRDQRHEGQHFKDASIDFKVKLDMSASLLMNNSKT